MNQDNIKLKIIKEIKKDLELDLLWPIWNTIICSGPFLYFLICFLERDMKTPAVAIIISVIAMIWIILNWYWYVKGRNDFNKCLEEISLELDTLDLHTLDFDEEPSKDIVETIFNILMITAIASLIMTIVFTVIELLTELTCLRYLLLFSVLILLISGAGLIITGVILLFKFIRLVIKCGKFKKVFKRFILIYIISFTILMITNLIIHKSPRWILSLLYSLTMTFPAFLLVDDIMLYKKIKKEYPSITSSDDCDSK